VGFEPTRRLTASSGFQDRLALAQRCGLRPFRASKCASALEVGVGEGDRLVPAAGHQVVVPVERDRDRGVAEERRECLRVHAGGDEDRGASVLEERP